MYPFASCVSDVLRRIRLITFRFIKYSSNAYYVRDTLPYFIINLQ